MSDTAARVAAIKALHASKGSTPEGALHAWLSALYLALEPEHREAGLDLLAQLTIPLMKDDGWSRRASYQTFLGRIKTAPHIFRSYATGSSPDNGYAMDPEDFQITVERVQDAGDLGTKVFIHSSGADNPRPVYLKRSTKSGLYYVNTFSNVYLGVRAPVDPEAEQFV